MQVNNLIKAGILILFGVVSGVISSHFAFKNSSVNQIINKEDKIYIEENTALTGMVKEVESSVVGIKAANTSGSGLIVTSDGLIVTLASNVPSGIEFNLSINGEENIPYQVLKRDLVQNLALIKVEKTNLSTRSFSDLSQLSEGERVFTVSKQPALSVNEGIVKSFDDSNIITNIVETGRAEGSPVFDIQGNIIGLAHKDINNLVNVIPVSMIKSFAGL